MKKLYSGKTSIKTLRAHRAKLLFSLALGLIFNSAWAQQAQQQDCKSSSADSELCQLNFLDIKSLGGDFSVGFGFDGDISTDGTTIVGLTDDEMPVAYRWTESTGRINLGTLEGTNMSFATGVSSDGKVVVGFSSNDNAFDASQAFRWTESDGMIGLGTLVGKNSSWATGVSADGKVVAGSSGTDSANSFEAFRWTESDGMVGLGTLIGTNLSWANDVSGDGKVVVGFSGNPDFDDSQAFRWTESDGMIGLNSLEVDQSIANAVNYDGSVVVGLAGFFGSSTNGSIQAFRWTESEGMIRLGFLPNHEGSVAKDVSSDGKIVVGFSYSGNLDRFTAFRWTKNSGMNSLGVLNGYTESAAYATNDDGSIVLGASFNQGDDVQRPFIWRQTSSVEGIMEDYKNLITSFPVLANDSAVAQAEQQLSVGQMMSQNGFAGAGQTVMSARTEGQRTDKNPTRIGARNNSLASVSLGRGISDNFTLGATVSAQRSSMRNNAFDMGTGYGTAIWGTYNENPEMNTGIQMSGSIGYMRANGDVARGRLLTDVAVATGKARVETRAAQINLGYGISHDDWLVTPNFGLAYYDTRRSSYSENGPTFNANYNAMRTHRTVASLGVDGDYALSDQRTISLGLGVDHELNTKSPSLSGTSDIPGLATFNIDSNFTPNRTRPFGKVGYTHQFENGATVGGDLRVGRAVYGSTSSVGFGLTLNMLF